DVEHYYQRLEKFSARLQAHVDSLKKKGTPLPRGNYFIADALAEASGGLTSEWLNSTSIQQFEEDLKTFHDKLNGLKISSEKNNDEIFNLLDSQEQLKKSLGGDYQFDWMLHPERIDQAVSSRAKIIYDKLQSIFLKTDEVLNAHVQVGERIALFEKAEKKYQALLEQLKLKQTTWDKFGAILLKASDTLVNATSFALPENQNLLDGLGFVADTAIDLFHEVSDSQLRNLPHGLETLSET
ncbi:MAG TPA: hypothetical protein VFM46_06410, partial [Pseudomonadales bacterium]|nr:hypothetical protein [Pseudomonadales bacterium]